MNIIDLRSDTITRPSPAMRAAMAAADVGDDVFADDPTVNALQARIAEITGFEAALFMPTGTQSNLVGLMSHCQRGDEYIVGQMAHTYRWEGGGAAVLGSIQPQPLSLNADGEMSLDEITTNIKPDDAHFAKTRLITLENTHGGVVLSQDYVRSVQEIAQKNNLSLHMDGARIFNAAVAQNVPVAELLRGFDSASVCFSKGLGAPVGSALCGSREFIKSAHRLRKMVGGGMRQAGILAAGALYALEHNIARLAQDHANAARLADGINALGVAGLHANAQTNIVFIDVPKEALDIEKTTDVSEQGASLIAHLRSHNILATGLYKLRMVTHLDIDTAQIDATIKAVAAFYKA